MNISYVEVIKCNFTPISLQFEGFAEKKFQKFDFFSLSLISPLRTQSSSTK